jgi:tetratricopeptide (TPR) repeat protein
VSAFEAVGAPRSTGRKVPHVWGHVPQRNKNFTGREDLLRDLRRRIAHEEVTALLPHTLHGMGGVGKTQLAIEYVYRYQADYEVIWWITADQEPLMRSALAGLAPRLGLTDISPGRTDDAVTAVLDALRRGVPYERWLLVFDNADQPESARALIPSGPGHVLVTSRNHRWEGVADTVEVDVFTREESLTFFARRVPHIGGPENGQLAEELGDLPLALEQAGALLAESMMSAKTYLELLRRAATKILGENPPASYPVPVAAAWSVSVQRVKSETPDAMELLWRCAFFGPEPIPIELLNRARYVLDDPLREIFDDPLRLSRAIRALSRYALVRVDNRRNTLQVHRIIQKLLRDDVRVDEGYTIRHEVHLLLATADPGDPDEFVNWPKYADLLSHATPSRQLECRHQNGRTLARNIVRWLYVAGDYKTAKASAERALQRWVADSGDDHPDVLMMRRHLGNVLFALGGYQSSYNLNKRTLEQMCAVLGNSHEETLMLTNSHGADLRARGEFDAAFELDTDSVRRHRDVFGDDHPRTFMAASNLAVDYRIIGQYAVSLQLHEQNYHDRLVFYSHDDHPQVLYSLDQVARALRHAGDYAKAQEIEERVYRDYQEAVRQRVLPIDHPWVLGQAKSLSIARRKAGATAEALELASEVYEKSRRRYGVDHPDTLAAALSLCNVRRVTGDLEGATTLIEEAVQHYCTVLGAEHPYTQGAVMNHAIVLRALGDATRAVALLEETLERLERTIGDKCDHTLSCATNLASAFADIGNSKRARELGEQTLEKFRESLGKDSPQTLACAVNLALDLRALGQEEAAAELRIETLNRYWGTLGKDHPTVVAAAQGQRLDLDFEAPPL